MQKARVFKKAARNRKLPHARIWVKSSNIGSSWVVDPKFIRAVALPLSRGGKLNRGKEKNSASAPWRSNKKARISRRGILRTAMCVEEQLPVFMKPPEFAYDARALYEKRDRWTLRFAKKKSLYFPPPLFQVTFWPAKSLESSFSGDSGLFFLWHRLFFLDGITKRVLW